MQMWSAFTVTSTWGFKTIQNTLANPTWFVSTLLAIYILFPFILRALQSFSSRMLVVTVMTMYQVVLLSAQCQWHIYKVYRYVYLQYSFDHAHKKN